MAAPSLGQSGISSLAKGSNLVHLERALSALCASTSGSNSYSTSCQNGEQVHSAFDTKPVKSARESAPLKPANHAAGPNRYVKDHQIEEHICLPHETHRLSADCSHLPALDTPIRLAVPPSVTRWNAFQPVGTRTFATAVARRTGTDATDLESNRLEEIFGRSASDDEETERLQKSMSAIKQNLSIAGIEELGSDAVNKFYTFR
jgi:hypothetical protein